PRRRARCAPATVHYATRDGTATAGKDYVATSGTLRFEPGERQKTVAVEVIGDTVPEDNETFTVELSDAVGADIRRAVGTCTILDDDAGPDTFRFQVTSQWDTGFIAQGTVSNTTSRTWRDWTLEFDFAFTITSIWSAE